MNTTTTTENKATRYARFIRWSEDDACYVGSLPEICGDCCHGDTTQEVVSQLEEIALSWVKLEAEGEITLSPPDSCTVIQKSKYALSADTASMIARLRRGFGLSQAAFAAALGVSVSALSKWEQGIRKPDKASAKLLSIIEKHPEMLYC